MGRASLQGNACLPLSLGMLRNDELNIPIYLVFESKIGKKGNFPSDCWSLPIISSTAIMKDESKIEVSLPNGSRNIFHKSRKQDSEVYYPNSAGDADTDPNSFKATKEGVGKIILSTESGWKLTYLKGKLIHIKKGQSIWSLQYDANIVSIKRGMTKIFSVETRNNLSVVNINGNKVTLVGSFSTKNWQIDSITTEFGVYVFKYGKNYLYYTIPGAKAQYLEWDEKNGQLIADSTATYKVSLHRNGTVATLQKNTPSIPKFSSTIKTGTAPSVVYETYTNGKLMKSIHVLPSNNNLIRKIVSLSSIYDTRQEKILEYDEKGQVSGVTIKQGKEETRYAISEDALIKKDE